MGRVTHKVSFEGQVYARPLSQVMREEAYKEAVRTYKTVSKTAQSRAVRFLKAVMGALKRQYPQLSGDIELRQSRGLKNVQVGTRGSVITLPVEGASLVIHFQGRKHKVEISADAVIRIDGYSGGAKIDIGEYRAIAGLYIGAGWQGDDLLRVKSASLPSPSSFVKSVVSKLEANREWEQWANPGKYVDNVVTLGELLAWIEKKRTRFIWALERDALIGQTREEGDVGEETPGAGDIREARRIMNMFKQEFGDAVKVSLDTVDEWTYVEVRLNPKIRRGSVTKSENVMNRNFIARELVRVAKDLLAIEFDTEEAYKKYMKDHPGADKSKHTVKKAPAKKKSPDGGDAEKAWHQSVSKGVTSKTDRFDKKSVDEQRQILKPVVDHFGKDKVVGMFKEEIGKLDKSMRDLGADKDSLLNFSKQQYQKAIDVLGGASAK